MRSRQAAVAVLRDPEVELLAYLAAARTASRCVEPDVRNVKSDPTAMIVFGRIMRTGTAKDSFDIVEFGDLDEGLDDRRTPSSGV